MTYVAIVAMVALLEYLYFSIQVGQARGKYGIEAPATTGNEVFERVFRIHQNTLEQLIIFFPAMYTFAVYVDPLWAAGLGLVFVIGRAVYSAGYTAAPEKRGTGMLIGFAANAIMLLGGLVGAVMALL
ncbi:MAG: MAPEG family protein [Gammaproteobacteria bacterium]|nr:MAPEG family protein [Gammaproteobacteria bacterium]